MYPLETSLTGKTGARDTASETLIRVIFPIVTYCGGYSAGAPPLPIPNREVKPGRADGTAPPGGRVGRCRFCKRRCPTRWESRPLPLLQEEADCTGFRVFSLLSFYPGPLLLSSVTAPQVHLSWFCCISVAGVAPGRPTCHTFLAFLFQVRHCRVHLPQFCCVPAPGVPASAMVAYGLGCCAGYLLSGVMNAGSGKCIPAIVSPFFIA